MESTERHRDRLRLDPLRCLEARKRLGLSQEKLARRAGLGLATLKRIEGGKRCTRRSAAAYAGALSVSIDGLRSEGEVRPVAPPPRERPGTIRLDAERCLRARSAKGWSRDRLLAFATGEHAISIATVKRIEAGRAIQLESARCYARALGASVRSLMADDLSPARPVPETRGPRLIGRSQEIGDLLDGLRQVRAGGSSVMLLHGPPGIGKTSLLERFAAEVERRRGVACVGSGCEHVSVPFQAVVEALSPLPLDVPGLDASTRDTLHRWLGPTHPGPRHTEPRAVWSWLECVSRQRPVALIIDDLQWLDPPALKLFEQLALWAVRGPGLASRARVQVVAGCRPVGPSSPAAAAIDRLSRTPGIQDVQLPSLDLAGTRELVRRQIPWPSHQLVAMVFEATQGNPGFIEKSVDSLRARDLLVDQGGFTTTRALAGEIELPPDLTAAFRERCDALDPGCRSVLVPASFLGARFHLRVLAGLLQRGDGELRAALAEAVEAGLLRSHLETYSFSHPLARHVLYRAPEPAERADIHRRIARYLERTGSGSPIEVAEHLLRAPSGVDAAVFVRVLREGGDHATAVLAWHQGARLYSAAARRAEATAGPASAADLLERAAIAFHEAWDLGPALDHYRRALAGYSELGDATGRARVLDRQTRLAFNEGQAVDPAPLETAIDELGQAAPAERASLLCTLADVTWTQEPARAEARARAALEIARAAGEDEIACRVLNSLALSHFSKVEIEPALESWTRGRATASRMGNETLECEYVQRIPVVHLVRGDARALRASLDDAAEYGDSVDNPGGAALAVAVDAELHALRGSFDEAIRRAAHATVLLSRSQFFPAMTIVYPLLAWLHAQTGDFAGAAHALSAMREVRERHDSVSRLIARHQRLIDATELGAPVPGLAPAAPRSRRGPRAISSAEVSRAALAGELAALAPSGVPQAPALEVLEEADRRGMVFSLGWPVLLPRLLAVCAAREGRTESARELFERALALAGRAGARVELARTRLDYARCLWEARARAEADKLRADAEQSFASLGMAPWEVRARRAFG